MATQNQTNHHVICSGVVLASLLIPAHAENAYPIRPIRLIVPLSAGSAADVLARQLALRMTESWGQQVVVDNRPGAGGTIGVGTVAKADANGYTLLVHSAAFAVSAALYSTKLPYDASKDFVPVSQLAAAPIVLVAAPSLGARSVMDLVAMAKRKPRELNFGSSGVGTSTHLASEQFKVAAGIEVVHVPYKGPAEALLDTASGRVQYFLAPVIPAMPFVRDGRLLALGVTTAQRSPVLPDTPTVAEAGIAGYEYSDWWGLFAPARTPSSIVDRLSREAARILALPDVRKQMLYQGAEPKSSAPAEFAAFVRARIADNQGLIRVSGIRPE